jgi:DinB superfamily
MPALPGVGLSSWHVLLCKFLVLPLMCRLLSRKDGVEMFEREGWLILQMVGQLSPDQLKRRVLIRPFFGLEQDAIEWSPEMVLTHLIAADSGVCEIVHSLDHGDEATPAEPRSAKALETDGAGIVGRFRAFLAISTEKLKADKDCPTDTHREHPQFGKLSAHQWVVLAAFHQRVHRLQLDKILHA